MKIELYYNRIDKINNKLIFIAILMIKLINKI